MVTRGVAGTGSSGSKSGEGEGQGKTEGAGRAGQLAGQYGAGPAVMGGARVAAAPPARGPKASLPAMREIFRLKI